MPKRQRNARRVARKLEIENAALGVEIGRVRSELSRYHARLDDANRAYAKLVTLVARVQGGMRDGAWIEVAVRVAPEMADSLLRGDREHFALMLAEQLTREIRRCAWEQDVDRVGDFGREGAERVLY